MIDPISLEVARHRFSAIAVEMGGVLRRTSLSPNIKERADCSAAVFTAGGEMLAQAEHIQKVCNQLLRSNSHRRNQAARD